MDSLFTRSPRTKDVIYHHQNLQKSHPSPRLYFRSDAVKLDDLFRRVEEVTHQPLTDMYKLAAFFTHFHKDTRPSVAIIQTMMLMKETYAMTYKSVCNMTAFDDTPHHHALAITKTTELCRKYGLGTCPYADADCRHIHRVKAGSMLKLTDATPPTTSPSTWSFHHTKKPYPNHISQRHRAAMKGTVSPSNPIGISCSQIKKIYALQRSEGASTDSWLTGSIAHASGSTGVTNYPRLLMLRSTSSSSTAATMHTPQEEISDSSDNESVYYESVSFTPPAADRKARPNVMRSPLINVGTLVENYINLLRPTTRSDRTDWTLYVSRSAQLTDKPTALPIVSIFNWHDRGPARQMSYARSDIANGDSTLMYCLYRIVCQYCGYWVPNQFMMFSFSAPPIYLTDILDHASQQRLTSPSLAKSFSPLIA